MSAEFLGETLQVGYKCGIWRNVEKNTADINGFLSHMKFGRKPTMEHEQEEPLSHRLLPPLKIQMSRPAPGRGCEWCFALGRSRGRGYCKYH